jgi:glyceraldehyde 3-phosphate dehydrogenase
MNLRPVSAATTLHSSICDAAQTQVVGGDLVEVQSWYDNEWGFSNRMVDLTKIVSSAG